MPNKSVPIKLGGATYNLRFDFNALCEFEHAAGIPISEIGDKSAGSMGVYATRALLWAGLVWEKPGLSISEVGDMINLEEIGYIGEKLVEAITLALPEEKEENTGKNESSPKEKGGTGKST